MHDLRGCCEKIEGRFCAEHSLRPLGDNGVTGMRAATLYLSDFPALPSVCVFLALILTW